MLSNQSHLREFGEFRLDLDKKVLWHADEPVSLPAKAVEVLCELLEHPGEIVTKDELLDRVWSDSFVEESVLAQNIHHLRKTFRELYLERDLIQTIPRRGYRFVGETHLVDDTIVFEHEIVEREVTAEIRENSLSDISDKQVLQSRRLSRWFAFAVITFLIGAGAFLAWRAFSPNQPTITNGIRSIAVLPLKPLNEKDEVQTLSLGLTDSLIGRLGRLNRFAVRPFSAVEKYETSGKDAIEFGRTLNADSVLEGTIQTAGDKIRVSLRLLDVRDGTQIWTDSFDETEANILELQDLVSMRVAHALIAQLNRSDQQMLSQSPTTSDEAFRLYVAGRERWLRRNWTADSLAFYQKAIELDPNFALAHLGIADHFAFTYETAAAEDALNRALALDPELAEAHATRGFLRMFHHWDWQGAESSFRRSIELAPNSSKAHHWYGVYLSIRGRHDQALVEMNKALELDPTALVVRTDIAELYYFMRDYEVAESELQRVLDIDPGFRNARERLTKVRYMRGVPFFLENAALDVYIQKQNKSAGLDYAFRTEELEKLISNRDEKALAERYVQIALETVKEKPEAYLGLSKYFAVTGEKEKSLTALEKAFEARSFIIPFVGVDPLWDPIRDDARFKEIVRRMNL